MRSRPAARCVLETVHFRVEHGKTWASIAINVDNDQVSGPTGQAFGDPSLDSMACVRAWWEVGTVRRMRGELTPADRRL